MEKFEVPKRKLLDDIADKTMATEIAQVLSPINLALKYKWVINNADLNTTQELGLAGVNK